MIRTIKECDICGSNVSLSNFTRHRGSKQCLSGGKCVADGRKQCNFCKIEFSTSSGRSLHEMQCISNPDKVILHKNKIAWNKGNKTVPDLRDPEYIGKIGGYRKNAGRSKKFKVIDSFGNETTLQSSFEYKCKNILEEMGVNWFRPKALKYNNKNYFADFYLPDFDLWLDPKNNYKAKQDEEKIFAVIEQNNVNLHVLLEHQITEDYIKSLIAGCVEDGIPKGS